MADQFITDLDAVTTFSDTDLTVVETDPTGTPETNKMTQSNYIAEFLKRTTYTISRTVSSNNLIVALKNAAGGDATTAAPVRIQIGNTYRSITGALSIQVNAGASSFALGGTMFAALRQDLFVYVGWRAASSTVFILISRIPYGRTFADFSTTATAENYGAASGSVPASTDEVVNIGRVSVQNSGTASYNWSVPTANVVLNQPTMSTDWLSWVPTFTNLTVGSGSLSAKYRINDRNLSYIWKFTYGAGSAVGNVSYTLPYSREATFGSDVFPAGIVRLYDTSAPASFAGVVYLATATTAILQQQSVSATYLQVGALSSTVPFTWTTGDAIHNNVTEYPIG